MSKFSHVSPLTSQVHDKDRHECKGGDERGQDAERHLKRHVGRVLRSASGGGGLRGGRLEVDEA